METSILEMHRRRDIFQCINQNPGAHIRELSRTLGIPPSSLQYHLRYLEKRNFIISMNDGKYCRYYIALENGVKEKKILNCLRNKTILNLLLWFFITVQSSQKDLSRYLEKHPATINFHLKRMMQAGMIEQASITQGVVYSSTQEISIPRPQISSEKIYVLKDAWMIYDILKKNKDKLGQDNLVNTLIEYVDFVISDGVPKQVQNRENTKESLLTTFFRFFFPPSFSS